MGDSLEKHSEVTKKKRGPYKRYVDHGSVAQIPATTTRGWKALKRAEFPRRTDPSGEDHHGEEMLSDHKETDLGIDKDKDTKQPELKQFYDLDMQVEGAVVESEEENVICPETDASFSENDYDPAGDQKEQPSETAERYDKDFLVKALLILSTKLRHNLTYEAAEDIIKLMVALGHSPDKHATKYCWKKIVNDFSTWMTVHYICNICGEYVDVKSNDEILCCSSCGNVVKDLDLSSNHAFLYISLTHQLKDILELTKLHERMQEPRQKQRPCAIEDIYDGALYKMKVGDGMISINFSVDGVPVFDSTKFTIYPLLCTVNELRPDQRKNHVLLCGLWFGQGKPNMNAFLKPFVTEAQTLYNDGFTYEYKDEKHTKKCCVLVGVCDSVARPTVRNSTQFNGAYGCGLCLHPGENIAKGRGYTRVYPLDAQKRPFGEGLRTHEQSLRHAADGEKGFRSKSVLCDIPQFDIVSSLDVDWMHSVALGVCRQFAKLWFDSSNHDQEFYFGNLVDDVDMVLISFCPTIEVSRTPRKISDRSHWKAHEWVIFLLFYSLPTLLRFFPKKYVDHWALLVDSIQILSKTSILKSEIIFAHDSLLQFIDRTERLYGRKHVSFNVHLLAHLSRSVENWGPLWTHSAFIYENFNQTLLKYVKSANGVAKQICDTFRTRCVVERLRYMCWKQLTTDQKAYLDHLRMKHPKPKSDLIVNETQMLGTLDVHENMSREQYLAFQRVNIVINDETNITSYKRAIVNGEVVHSKAYARVQKRRNYYVRLIDGEIFEIHLFYVLTSDTVSCYALGKYFTRKTKRLINDSRLEHLTLLEKRIDDLAVIRTSMIKEKVIMLQSDHLNVWIACIHPNNCELLT